jgi:predicted transcriptional regulator
MRKPAPPREIPPPLELECLKVLWKTGEASVKEVREALAGRKDLAYTTVMTLLDRLVRRGSASRRKVGRLFVYTPIANREALRAVAVRELVEAFFDGSVESLLEYLRHATESGPVKSPEPSPEGRVTEERLDTALL